MKFHSLTRVVSALISVLLILNSFAPFIFVRTAYASESPVVSLSYHAGSPSSFLLDVDAGVVTGHVGYALYYKNEQTDQIENARGETEFTDSHFSRTIDTGTCSSNGVCISHTVRYGVVKVHVEETGFSADQWFKVENGSVVIVQQDIDATVDDLTPSEQAWLQDGTLPTPTVVVTTPSAVPTQEEVTPTPSPVPTEYIVQSDEAVVLDVIRLDGSYVDPAFAPATWTDKLDYRPTEKVVVSGKNFNPGQTYTIYISSSDEPAVSHTDTFLPLDNGTFTYEYQLDGYYRADYSVIITDASGQQVASTTFQDHFNYVMRINNNASTTLVRPVTLNMSWDSLLIDPSEGRYVEVNGSSSCPSDSSSTWSAWETLVGAGSNKAVKAWTLTGAAGTRKVCSQTRHWGILSWSVESSYDTIQFAPDTTPPVITVTGPNPQTVEAGTSYLELGATVSDNVDSGLTATIDSSAVDVMHVGSYTVTYNAVDSAGNHAVQKTRTVNVVDTTAPPVPTLQSPSNEAYIKQTDAILRWNTVTDISGPVTYNYKSAWTGGTYGPVSTGTTNQINATGSVERTYTWQVQACDSLLHCSDWSGPWTVTIDSTAPVVNAGVDRLSNALFTQTGTATDSNPISGYQWSKVSGPGTLTFGSSTSLSTTVIASIDGTYVVRLTSTDAAGNVGSDDFTLTWDSTGPAAPTLIVPLNNAYVTSTTLTNSWSSVPDAVTYIYESYYDVGATSLRWHQEMSAPTTSKTATGVTDAVFWWRVRAVDAAGNLGGWSDLWKVTVDTTKPGKPTITTPSAEAYFNSTPILNQWTAISDFSGIKQYWVEYVYDDGHTFSGGPYRYTTTNSRNHVPALTEQGGVTIRVRAEDNAGNLSDWSDSIHYTYDATAPTVMAVSSDGNTYNSASSNPVIKITFNEALATAPSVDVHSVGAPQTVTDCDDLDAATYCFTYTLQNEETTHTISIYNGADLAGNIMASNTSHTFVVDRIAPRLTGQTTYSGWYKTAQTSTFTYTDAALASGYTDPSCVITTEGVNQTCDVNDVNVCDIAGNCNTTPVTSNGADQDFTVPTSVIVSPTNTGTNAVVYSNSWDGTIEGTATDTLSGVGSVELSIKDIDGRYWNGSDWSSTSEVFVTATGTNNWSYILPSPLEGSYTITSHATDGANNRENTYTITIILDKTIPEVALSIDPLVPDAANGWYKTQPTVTLSATDSHFDRIEYQWNGTGGAWTTYIAPFQPNAEGAAVLYYRARDLADNYSDIGIKNIKWNKTDLTEGPLHVNVSPNPTNGTTSKVTWDAASSATIGIDKYEVQWKLKDGSGSTYTVSVGSDVREYTMDNLTAGVWLVKVTAFDASGNNKSASADLTVDKTAPNAPTLSLVGTGVGTVTLSWSKVDDAVNYIIWYGVSSGSYQYGAKVGDTQSYVVQGLGSGSYYFIVQSVDAGGNHSGNSNEVSTGTITGAPGVAANTPAQGFASEVLGANTMTPTPTPHGQIMGVKTAQTKPWWWPWVLLLLIPPAFWMGYKKWKKT